MLSEVCARLAATTAVSAISEPEEIDAGGDDHLGDAHRDDADDRHLQHDQQQAVRIQQERLIAQVPAEDFEDQRDADHHDEDAGILRHFAAQPGEQRSLVR